MYVQCLKASQFRNILPVCTSCIFFQAEGGIRGADVTGVQTCALPIFPRLYGPKLTVHEEPWYQRFKLVLEWNTPHYEHKRSEERRVGKECRSWWTAQQ